MVVAISPPKNRRGAVTYDGRLTNEQKNGCNLLLLNKNARVMDKTTLIAASVPVMLFVGMVVYVVVQWRKRGSIF
ncbi:MAG: hypothetical protein H6550_11745 [Chitinophagales bacterium]|nr:hypothetical protein [Chitinophagales bacterium]